jgi:hypothetical protein
LTIDGAGYGKQVESRDGEAAKTLGARQADAKVLPVGGSCATHQMTTETKRFRRRGASFPGAAE